jgi:hypothetical protein
MLEAHVGIVEAYSIPAASVALLAGLVVRRTKPQKALGSWVAYGPALTTALLPSLAAIASSTARPYLLGRPPWPSCWPARAPAFKPP